MIYWFISKTLVFGLKHNALFAKHKISVSKPYLIFGWCQNAIGCNQRQSDTIGRNRVRSDTIGQPLHTTGPQSNAIGRTQSDAIGRNFFSNLYLYLSYTDFSAFPVTHSRVNLFLPSNCISQKLQLPHKMIHFSQ